MGKITTLPKEELELFSKSPSEVMREKLEKLGDADALAEFESYRAMCASSHDMYVNWVAVGLDALYKKAGADAVQESLMGFFAPFVPENAEDYYNISFHDRVVALIDASRKSHDVGVIVDDEDEEKLIFHFAYCGAGQRLVEQGWYDEPHNLTRCPASNLTAGICNFPIYCTHDPAIDMLWLNKCGYPQKVLEYATPVGSCPCKYVLYKNKEDIPEKYFTRVGFEKPKSCKEK